MKFYSYSSRVHIYRTLSLDCVWAWNDRRSGAGGTLVSLSSVSCIAHDEVERRTLFNNHTESNMYNDSKYRAIMQNAMADGQSTFDT